MKLNRKILVFTLAATAVSWVMPAFAQDAEVGTDAATQPKFQYQRDDRVISRMLRNPDEAPELLRDQVSTLRDSQKSIRDAWVENYRPGDGASAEEIKAAREAFQEAFKDEIQASKTLRVSVIRELRAGIRDTIGESTWNEQARALYAEYKSTQSGLSGAWRAVRSELGRDATREEVAAARERFSEANSELIARQKELALMVRELIRENRENREIEREELPRGLKDLRSDMAALRDQVRSRQQRTRQEMLHLSREERESYRRALLEDLKELHDEIKVRRRQVIDEIRDGPNGDRRPEG